MTLIVRLGRDHTGQITGLIERVRTGQKERFSGMDGLAALVARLAAEELPAETPTP